VIVTGEAIGRACMSSLVMTAIGSGGVDRSILSMLGSSGLPGFKACWTISRWTCGELLTSSRIEMDAGFFKPTSTATVRPDEPVKPSGTPRHTGCFSTSSSHTPFLRKKSMNSEREVRVLITAAGRPPRKGRPPRTRDDAMVSAREAQNRFTFAACDGASKGMADPARGLSGTAYERAPLLLNLELTADGSWRLASTWCNLGLWRNAITFRSACADLARLLGHAADLSAGDEVLDVGVGYGDQVILWLNEFHVKRVVAVESSPTVAAAARAALVDRPAASVVHADACKLSSTALTSAAASFDAVLCLDCAYHFSTRSSFVAAAMPLLRPAGRFAAIDLLPTDLRHNCGFGWLAQRLVALAVGIPWSNLYDQAAYATMLRDCGLVDVRIRPVDGMVFAPLATYAAEQKRRLRASGDLSWREGVLLSAVSALMGFVSRHRLFHLCVVTARRPG
jgi:SAM-dependent methyltransferase